MKNYASKGKTKKTDKKKHTKKDIKNSTLNNEAVKDEQKLKDNENKSFDKDSQDKVGQNDVSENKDPLIDAEPIEAEYGKPNVLNDGDVKDIPEDTIERPTIDLSDDTGDPAAELFLNDAENIDFGGMAHEKAGGESQPMDDTSSSYKEPSGSNGIGNKDLDGRSKKEKTEASSYLADTIIDGYEMAHSITLNILVKDDEKIMKQAMKGKIDPDVIESEIQIGKNVYKIRELVHDYNVNLKDVLIVSDEFKEQAKPLLEEELARNNMGITPMQRLLALVVKDVQPKIIKIAQLSGTMNDVLKQQSKILQNHKEYIKDQQKKNDESHVIIEDDTKKEPEEKTQSNNIDDEIDE